MTVKTGIHKNMLRESGFDLGSQMSQSLPEGKALVHAVHNLWNLLPKVAGLLEIRVAQIHLVYT